MNPMYLMVNHQVVNMDLPLPLFNHPLAAEDHFLKREPTTNNLGVGTIDKCSSIVNVMNS